MFGAAYGALRNVKITKMLLLPLLKSTTQKPTLFLRGDKSEYIGPTDEGIIHRHFTDAEIQTISNAGHWLHAENPKDFYDAVVQFINL